MDAVFIGKMSIGAKRHIPQIIKLCFVCRAVLSALGISRR